MQRYREFRPTGLDPAGLGLDGRQEWYVGPVSITRDDPEHSRTASNWRAFLGSLYSKDPDGTGFEVHRFGHWGPGWFEIVLIDPDRVDLVIEGEETEGFLENYPVLDDSDLSAAETEAQDRAWEGATIRDRIGFLRRTGLSYLAARHPTLDVLFRRGARNGGRWSDEGELRDALIGED